MLAAAFGALMARVSDDDVVSSGSAKLDELVRLVVAAGDPSVVPFGP